MSAEKKYPQILDIEKEWQSHEEKLSKQPDKCPLAQPIISTFFSYFLNQNDEDRTEMAFSQLCMLPSNISSVKLAQDGSLDTKDLKEIYTKLNS